MLMRDGLRSVSMDCGALCAIMDQVEVMDLILMLQKWCVDNWEYQTMVSCDTAGHQTS